MHLNDVHKNTHTHTPAVLNPSVHATHTHTECTIRDENASQHGAKNNAECDHLEAQRGHVTSGSKRPIFLLSDGTRSQVGEKKMYLPLRVTKLKIHKTERGFCVLRVNERSLSQGCPDLILEISLKSAKKEVWDYIGLHLKSPS